MPELRLAAPIGVINLITAEELAALFGCSTSHVYEIAARGDIPCLRIGRLIRFELEAVLAALRNSGGGE